MRMQDIVYKSYISIIITLAYIYTEYGVHMYMYVCICMYVYVCMHTVGSLSKMRKSSDISQIWLKLNQINLLFGKMHILLELSDK